MADPRFQPVPTVHSDQTEHRRLIANTVNLTQQGKLNAVLDEWTIDANQATTTMSDPRLGYDSTVEFDPVTANAAAEKAAGGLYATVAQRGDETWTFNHANNAQADRTFRVTIIG